MTLSSIPLAHAATVLPVIANQSDIASQTKEEKKIIDNGTIQMATIDNAFAYAKPSDNSKILFSITGGTVVSADFHAIGDEFIAVEYNKKICYVKGDLLKIVVSNSNKKVKEVAAIAKEHQFTAENIVKIIPAPHHYSVGGNTLYYNYQDYIWTLCVKFDIEEYFTYLLCQFYQESSYNQYLVSSTNDYGICQLNKTYHKYFLRMVGHPEWDVIHDPYANMYCGVYLMSQYIKNRGDLDLAMTDYNAGSGYTDTKGVRHAYTDRVHAWYKTLKQLD
jgi:hypothetical protein